MIMECRHCREPFDHWVEGTKGWGPREPVDIVCPSCGGNNGQALTVGYVRSQPLSAEQRDSYEQSKRRAP